MIFDSYNFVLWLQYCQYTFNFNSSFRITYLSAVGIKTSVIQIICRNAMQYCLSTLQWVFTSNITIHLQKVNLQEIGIAKVAISPNKTRINRIGWYGSSFKFLGQHLCEIGQSQLWIGVRLKINSKDIVNLCTAFSKIRTFKKPFLSKVMISHLKACGCYQGCTVSWKFSISLGTEIRKIHNFGILGSGKIFS